MISFLICLCVFFVALALGVLFGIALIIWYCESGDGVLIYSDPDDKGEYKMIGSLYGKENAKRRR